MNIYPGSVFCRIHFNFFMSLFLFLIYLILEIVTLYTNKNNNPCAEDTLHTIYIFAFLCLRYLIREICFKEKPVLSYENEMIAKGSTSK